MSFASSRPDPSILTSSSRLSFRLKGLDYWPEAIMFALFFGRLLAQQRSWRRLAIAEATL